MRRWFWILGLALCLMAVGGLALAETVLYSGDCGTGMTWKITLDDDGLKTLTISGKGAITDAPWQPGEAVPFVDGLADRLVLNEGITAIPEQAFRYALNQGMALKMPSTLRSIGREAFLGAMPVSLSLNEGLVSIEQDAFDTSGCCPAVVVPRSLTDIGYQALPQGGTLYVYAGSEGEQWCEDWGVPHIVLTGALSGRQKSLKGLLDAIAAADDVPMRYRQPAIDAVKAMTGLTAAQLDGLTEYVKAEYATLRSAMADNELTRAEIAGFVSRFVSAMDGIGVSVTYGIDYIGDHLGVKLTVTVNGDAQTLSVYRDGRYWRLSRLPQGKTSNYTWREAGGEIVITGYAGSASSLSVPATLNGKPVIGVEGREDDWPSNLVNLELPEGLKFIGTGAFMGMEKLVNVSLPESLEYIYDWAFDSCQNLDYASITFGQSLKGLGEAFQGTSVLEHTLYLPASVEWLGGRYDYLSIDTGNPHFVWEDGALYHEDTKTLLWASQSMTPENFKVRAGTRYIGKLAFCGNSVIKRLTLPDSVIGIGSSAFEGCERLEVVTLNTGLERIDDYAFAYCEKLYALDLPPALTELGYEALRDTAISGITIPVGLFTGPDDAWAVCRLIKRNLDKLDWIEVAEGHPLYAGRDGMLYEKATHTLLYAPKHISGGTLIVPNDTWAIGERAFEGCAAMTGIILPEGLTHVGSDALSGTGIVDLSFPSTVVSVANQREMYELLYVRVPPSVTEMGAFEDSGFDGPDKKTAVYGVPGSAAQTLAEHHGWDFVAAGGSGIHGFQLFADGKPIATTLEIWQGDVVELLADNDGSHEDAVTWELGGQANQLSAQILAREGRVLLIGGGAAGKSTYTVRAADDPSVKTPLTVTVKALSAATPNCAMLPSGLRVVEANAFRGARCRYVYIPDGATEIGGRAFMDCPNLRVVRLPKSLERIAPDAFKGCKDLVVLCERKSALGISESWFDGENIRVIEWSKANDWMPSWLIN